MMIMLNMEIFFEYAQEVQVDNNELLIEYEDEVENDEILIYKGNNK